MKRVYFVRHGESEANAAGVHGGPAHPLTERGLKQARVIAKRCKNLPLQLLVTSDFVRAQQTAQVIAEEAGLKIETSPDFGEVRGLSNLTDVSFDDPELKEAHKNFVRNIASGYRAGDEENFDDLVARADRALQYLTQREEEHVAVVTHGLFLRCIIARALFRDQLSARELLALWYGFDSENTGLSILEYYPDTPHRLWRLFVWNDHAHLG